MFVSKAEFSHRCICFAADGESGELQPDGNDGIQQWTRRLMQEKMENQSWDQPQAGEPVGVCCASPQQKCDYILRSSLGCHISGLLSLATT